MTWPVCTPPQLPLAPTGSRASRTAIPNTCTYILPALQVGKLFFFFKETGFSLFQHLVSHYTVYLTSFKLFSFAFRTMICHWDSLGLIKEESTQAVLLTSFEVFFLILLNRSSSASTNMSPPPPLVYASNLQILRQWKSHVSFTSDFLLLSSLTLGLHSIMYVCTSALYSWW